MKLLKMCLLFFPLSLHAALVSTFPVTLSPVNDATLGGSSLAQVAVNPTGDSVAVWENATLNSQAINTIGAAVYSAATGTWVAPFLIGMGNDPQVAIDFSGNAIAVWVNKLPTSVTWIIQASHYSAATGTWSDVVNVASSSDNLLTPQIAMNGNTGNAIAVWADGVTRQIYGTSFSGGSWSTDITQISVQSGLLPHIDIANDTGVATVVWQTYVPSFSTPDAPNKSEIRSSFVNIS